MRRTPLNIGGLTLDNPVILGPMAGVTDLPFRVLCREMGAALVTMEMVSAKGIHYHNRNTEDMLAVAESEHPVALQLFGSEPDLMGEIVKSLEERPFDVIDLNMGCPVPKVVKNGEGSALMREPKKAAAIVRAMADATKKPVTVKIRKGFNDEEVNAIEVAKYLEDAGAAAITVHGRTREEYYNGTADWNIIRDVAGAVSIPVIGNGDVRDGKSAKAMLDETGAAFVMISRAAMGNPWVFREVTAYLETGESIPGPSLAEKKALIRRHAQMKILQKGEYIAMREMRSHLIWYTNGIPHASRLRKEAGEIEKMADLERVLDQWSEAVKGA